MWPMVPLTQLWALIICKKPKLPSTSTETLLFINACFSLYLLINAAPLTFTLLFSFSSLTSHSILMFSLSPHQHIKLCFWLFQRQCKWNEASSFWWLVLRRSGELGFCGGSDWFQRLLVWDFGSCSHGDFSDHGVNTQVRKLHFLAPWHWPKLLPWWFWL